MPHFYTKLDLGAISDFHGFQKNTLWTTFSHKVSTFAVTVSWFGRPCRDLAFHETILITVPFGPSGFFKVTFVDGDWLMFFSSFFLCAMFSIHLSSHLIIKPR